jgi:hypothetical protein
MIIELRLNLRAPALRFACRVAGAEAGKAEEDLVPGCPQHLQSGGISLPQAPSPDPSAVADSSKAATGKRGDMS